MRARLRGVLTAFAMLVLAGCQSLSSLPEPAGQGADEAPNPAYLDALKQIDAALAQSQTEPVPTSALAYAARAEFLRDIGDTFRKLIAANSATSQEFPLWGAYFNAVSDTVEAVVAGDANLVEAERLYDAVAGLYPHFLERSHLPERPYIAVDGETSAFYAGNYFLCTMPEVLADAHGKRGAADMSVRLEQAMERFLAGPCEPDLMFSATELLYDYALVSGPKQADYRRRIEQAGSGRSRPWLTLLENLDSNPGAEAGLVALDQAMAEARAGLEPDDTISEEFRFEWERQRRLLKQARKLAGALNYQP